MQANKLVFWVAPGHTAPEQDFEEVEQALAGHGIAVIPSLSTRLIIINCLVCGEEVECTNGHTLVKDGAIVGNLCGICQQPVDEVVGKVLAFEGYVSL